MQTIKKAIAKEFYGLPPHSWKGAKQNGGGRTALMTCGNGHTFSLSKHSISKTGIVVPSVVCPITGCDFHEWIILGGWYAS